MAEGAGVEVAAWVGVDAGKGVAVGSVADRVGEGSAVVAAGDGVDVGGMGVGGGSVAVGERGVAVDVADGSGEATMTTPVGTGVRLPQAARVVARSRQDRRSDRHLFTKLLPAVRLNPYDRKLRVLQPSS